MSNRTVESAFEDSNVRAVRRFLSEYRFFIGNLRPEICVRLYQTFDRNEVQYDQSHFIHTPKQAGAYTPSAPYGDDEAHALYLAVSSLTSYYRQAVEQGEQPTDSWLEVNPDF